MSGALHHAHTEARRVAGHRAHTRAHRFARRRTGLIGAARAIIRTAAGRGQKNDKARDGSSDVGGCFHIVPLN